MIKESYYYFTPQFNSTETKPDKENVTFYNLQNVVDHGDNVLHGLVARNVRHQVQKCPRTLHNKAQSHIITALLLHAYEHQSLKRRTENLLPDFRSLKIGITLSSQGSYVILEHLPFWLLLFSSLFCIHVLCSR